MNEFDAEPVDDQLDRLNTALHQMLHLARCETPAHGHVSRMSIAPSEKWYDDNLSDNSYDRDFDALHGRFEALLLENDRLMMVIEDQLSRELRVRSQDSLTALELQNLIKELNSLTPENPINFKLASHNYTLTLHSDSVQFKISQNPSEKEIIKKLQKDLKELEDLRKTESSSNSNSVDHEETCPTCGIDPINLKKEVKLELQADFIKKRNEAIERERANIEAQFEEIEQIKGNYMKKIREIAGQVKLIDRKKLELEQKEQEINIRRNQFEKKVKMWELKVLNDQGGELGSEEGYSPSKFSREELEAQLKELKGKIDLNSDSKLAMRVNQIETQLTRLRTEKLLNECNSKNSVVISNLVKAFDKEKIQDENKRNKMLRRTQMNYLSVFK